jgi:hypothetical protein
VSKDWKPGKKTVELQPPPRPSRIRREPVRVQKPAELDGDGWWHSEDWELRIAIAGIILFALGINAMGFLISQVLIR